MGSVHEHVYCYLAQIDIRRDRLGGLAGRKRLLPCVVGQNQTVCVSRSAGDTPCTDADASDSTASRETLGKASFSSSNLFPFSSVESCVNPVTCPPGLA